jgi:glycosyltransferase involved in cell wall biosynthesis
MKIAIFTDTYVPDINGVARTLKRFTDYLEQNQIKYKVFAPESSNDHFFSANIHRFISLPFFLYPECRLALPNMLTVKEELLKFKPDIIHVATPFNVGLCGLHYAKKLNIPIVGSYHTDFDQYLEYYDLQFLSKILWKYMKWFHRPLKKIFVPSEETREQLKRHGFSNVSIWSRGVDCSQFHPNYDRMNVRKKYKIKEKYILTYVGRIAPEKDIDTLMKIATHLPPYIKDQVHWLIVGDGPLKNELITSAEPNMTFTGYLKGHDLAETYAASDVFVFPSPTETFGNVVLESMACGTPVVGADSGGVKNIITHGKNGLLCEPKNVEDFVQSIITLLTNDELRSKMGLQARMYALTQNWDTIFEGLLQHYEEAIEQDVHIRYA